MPAPAAVADAQAGFHADLADLGALLRRDAGRGRFLHHLLVAALHRAVALAKVDRVALAIGQHLDFDVARVLQELLHVDLIVAEGRLGLLLGHHDGVAQVRLGAHHAHAASAAAAGRLDDDGVADLARDAQVLLDVVAQRPAGTWHAGHARGLHRADRLHLVAHQADHVRGGSDEDEAGLLHLLGEVGALGEEAVARMDRLGVADLRRGDDARDVEIALARRRRADADRLVGKADVLEVAVRGGVHRHRLDAEAVAGAQHAQRDFAAVGDEDFF